MSGDSSLQEPVGAPAAPVPDAAQVEDATASLPFVNLQVVSPSAQVRSPLSFQRLPATTTVGELKDKIRSALETAPCSESQRLIYRGRMLARDSETMMEIFGEETLKTPDQQTFHLVLRPTANDMPTSSSSTPIPSSSNSIDGVHASPGISRSSSAEHGMQQPGGPGPRRVPQIPPHHHHNLMLGHNELQQRLMIQRLQGQVNEIRDQLNALWHQHNPNPNPTSAPQMPSGFQAPPQYPSNLPGNIPFGPQNPGNTPGNPQYSLPVFQNMFAQQMQQGRGTPPLSGPTPNAMPSLLHQHQAPLSRSQSPSLPQGQTPDHTTTYTRHGVNANGDRWQITVNESTTVIPPGTGVHRPSPQPGHSDPNLQNILQTAERLSAMQARLTNAQRYGGPPGSSIPSAPQRPSSTPPTNRIARPTSRTINSFPFPASMPTAGIATQPHESPVVYIMSSPSGPQALLINNSQSFYSPGYITHQTAPAAPASELRNRRERPHRRHRQREANNVAPDGPPPEAAPPQQQNAPAQQRPQAVRIALWPHLWLIIRLLFFVWWFTYDNNSSWSRILTFWGIAVILFVVNTGIFNDVFGVFVNPIRHHLENLLPLAGPNPPAAAQAPPEAQEGNAGGRRPEPNPEEVARRLLEQRRQQDASWLMTQFRRIEHSVLLFLASLVPGTAERHIEARTMEENRLLEERRQAAAAAEAAAEQARSQEGEGAGAAVAEEPAVNEGESSTEATSAPRAESGEPVAAT